MTESFDYLSPEDLPPLDSNSSLDELGPIHIDNPTLSLHGDGILDTETIYQGDEVILATDSNHDGVADHVKVIDADAEYSAWEYRKDAAGEHWVRTDHGKL